MVGNIPRITSEKSTVGQSQEAPLEPNNVTVTDTEQNSKRELDEPTTEQEDVSKSQKKRDADSIRDLGSRLADLRGSELANIPLPEDIISAINELNRIKAHGARKRQLGFLAKKMRHIDIAPIEAALEALRQSARANTKNLHTIENWRDRLLGDIPGETGKQALTEFLDQYKDADRQHFRHLQRQALAERLVDKPPAAARQLFKAIRDVLQNP